MHLGHKLKLVRQYKSNQTPGSLGVYNKAGELLATFATIELVWNDNIVCKSCIIAKTYTVTKELHWSWTNGGPVEDRKFKGTDGYFFLIHDVEGRSYIYIHYANYSRQLLGCIAPGYVHEDIDLDGLVDVTNTVDSMKALLDWMPDKFEIEII